LRQQAAGYTLRIKGRRVLILSYLLRCVNILRWID